MRRCRGGFAVAPVGDEYGSSSRRRADNTTLWRGIVRVGRVDSVAVAMARAPPMARPTGRPTQPTAWRVSSATPEPPGCSTALSLDGDLNCSG
jgi:hypothetical protein